MFYTAHFILSVDFHTYRNKRLLKTPSIRIVLLLFAILSSPILFAQQNSALFFSVDSIAKTINGKVSVAALNFETRDAFGYKNQEKLPMLSVFKFPIALAILSKIDKGEFSLQHKIHVTPKDMIKDTWSPMRDSFPDGNIDVTFENLIKYMVSQSDNIACDVLLHHFGGQKKLQKYIRKLGIVDFSVKYNEVGMHKNWTNQYKNWSTTNAMNHLLELFFTEKVLSKTNTDFLYKVMAETTTGQNKIVKLLPNETIVAHKTGFSGANDSNLIAANNDIGIITLPNGQHLALSIFVSNITTKNIIIEDAIAKIAKLVYDDFSK